VHLGLGSTAVAPSQREERKSIGAERTFSTLADKESVLKKLDDVAVELAKDMTESGWVGKTITLKYKLDTFQCACRTN
jgi:DNA polymerase kappa